MQKNKKLSARILSMALSVAMVATMMPATVFAAEGDVPLGASSLGASSIGTVQSFEKLEDRFEPSTGEGASKDVYALNVKLNTPVEDLNLPNELTAMVARTTTVSAPAEDEPVVDSGKPSEPVVDEVIPDDTVSGNQPATPSDAEEEVKEEIPDEDVPLAPKSNEETTVTTVEQETIPVTWNSDKEYVSDENGRFIYTAVLPEGYILADGVKLPQIYVLVGNQARATTPTGVCAIENQGYATLAEAFLAAKSGDTIKMLDNIDLGNTEAGFSGGKLLTLDLNGKSITGSSNAGVLITLAGTDTTLTVTDTAGNGKIEGSGSITISLPSSHKCNVIVSSGTVTATAGNGKAIVNSGTGNVTVSGGTVSASGTSSQAQAISNTSTGSVTVSSGTVSVSGASTQAQPTIINTNTGTINVSGGTVEAGNGVAIRSISTGKITVSGGTVTSKATGTGNATIYLTKKSTNPPLTMLEVTGGTVSNTADSEGYSVWFENQGITADNLSDYYSKTNGTVGKVHPEAATPTAVVFSTITANGTANTTDTTELTLTFDKDVTGLAAADITVTGATKGTLTKVDGQTGQYKLAISAITVAEGANVNVAVAKTGFTFNPANKDVAVHKAAASLAHNISTGNLTLTDTSGVCTGGCTESTPHVVTGTTTTNKIEVTSGTHYVTLDGVSIDVSATSQACAFEIKGSSTVNLKLAEGKTNTLKSGYRKAGISVPDGTTLSIGGTGTLNVTGGSSGAGIGGDMGNAAGSITIDNGTITALGGIGGAGIGGGNSNDAGCAGGIISITDGTVVAAGSAYGAGIGGGGSNNDTGGAGGSISITGGNVTARSPQAMGIGSGTGYQGTGDAPDPLTLTGMVVKYKVDSNYTGATNIVDRIIYKDDVQEGYATNVKLLLAYTGTEAAAPNGTPSAKTETSITLAEVAAPTDETIEYAYSTTNTAPTTGWQDSTAFTGLTANTQYYFFARVKANDKHWEGAASTGTAITTAAVVTFVPVTGISSVPTTATAGTPLTLTGIVAPTNATNKTIVWTVKSVGTTDATISGSTLNTTAAGTITVTATITNGLTASSNYAQDFTITVSAGINKTALTNAIAEANTLKGTVIVSNSAASAVQSGQKFVTTAEMKALTDAIAAAQAVANNPAATEAEITAAVTALNTAMTAFRTAIKTGTYVSGGGGGGGGSSSSGSSTTPPTKTEPVSGTSNTTATVDKNGNATTTVTDKNITDAVKAAKDAANKKGVNAGEITAVINVTAPANSNPNTVTVNLPKTVQQQVINNKIDNVAIVIDKPDISIGMNLATITEMNKQANADIQLSATRTDATKLSTEAKNAIGNRPAFDLKATYNSGAKSITSFGTGSVSVAIPYTLQSGEVAGGLYAVYIDGNGKANYITGSSYDANTKMLRFATNHFSVYGIGYKAPSTFTDIAGHWAKTDIEFVANRGLMSGTSNTTFAPNGSMTRGMFVTALGRLAGVDTNSYKTSKFTDVKADAYYAPYVNWAASKGITNGTTATTFSPDNTVTRQEMAVFMSNYAKAMGYKVPETREAVTFADNGSIGSWAAAAVKQMQMSGVLNGKNGNKFDPTGTATRAEVAAVLHRYVELVIDRSTAQGLDTNDSGSAMMYENGKAVKSASRTVGSSTYNFNANGEAALLPADNKKTGTYTVQKGDSFWLIAKKVGCTMAELEQLNGKSRNDFIYAGQTLKVPQK